MDLPTERGPEPARAAFDEASPEILAALDPAQETQLHRAINERRAQTENPELLRRLRSL